MYNHPGQIEKHFCLSVRWAQLQSLSPASLVVVAAAALSAGGDDSVHGGHDDGETTFGPFVEQPGAMRGLLNRVDQPMPADTAMDSAGKSRQHFADSGGTQ